MASEKPLSLASEFAREVKSREQGQLLSDMKLMAIALVMLLVGAAFIPDPVWRRSLGLLIVGVLLGVKGYASYLHWNMGRFQTRYSDSTWPNRRSRF